MENIKKSSFIPYYSQSETPELTRYLFSKVQSRLLRHPLRKSQSFHSVNRTMLLGNC
jgi:hypothetical protein